MRQKNLIIQEIRFCVKYGIVLMYVFFALFYVIFITAIPNEIREITGTILIFTDPAAMGLFFMGAIILLEKSQRVNCSLAVSPIKISEYIIAKVVSLMFMGIIIGLIISVAAGNNHLLITAIAIALSSAIFSLWGLVIAQKTESLNSFMIGTVPCEIIICIPAILYLFDFIKQEIWILHPGVSAIRLMKGQNDKVVLCMVVLVVWTIISYAVCYQSTTSYFKKMGGGKL